MSDLHVYYMTGIDNESCVVAIAHSFREAKKLAGNCLDECGCDSYTEIRGRIDRKQHVPDGITEPRIIDWCGKNNEYCYLWSYDHDGCDGCKAEAAKYRERYGEGKAGAA